MHTTQVNNGGSKPPIDFGWLVSAELAGPQLDTLVQARDGLRERLAQRFPAFDWRLPILVQPLPGGDSEVEPASLLDRGARVRDGHGWDFALVVTGDDLRCRVRSLGLAMPSRSLGIAAVSVMPLLTLRDFGEQNDQHNDQRLQLRFEHLVLHLLGDLNGLPHRTEDEVMAGIESLADLDAPRDFSADAGERLNLRLQEVADERLEERKGVSRLGIWTFYWQAAWISRRDIPGAVVQARPWEFPFRLSGLTIAALSTLFVLMVTAEAWELGVAQTLGSAGATAVLALAVGSAFTLVKQGLLAPTRPRLTEQIVLSNIAVTLVVTLGMLVSYLILVTVVLLAASWLYPDPLVSNWAGAAAATPLGRLSMAMLFAALALLVGALGASFEGQHHLRHVTFVDEEI